MRFATSAFALVVLLGATVGSFAAAADDACWFDPIRNRLICEDDGVITDPGSPGTDPWVIPDSGGLRYLYETTDPVIGDCYYWSNVPGGLDTWDPANDAAVIGVVVGTPECPPVAAVDPEARAWDVFPSWPLAVPEPTLQPVGHGITGLPSFLATNQPDPIEHTEVLPDGRTLDVKADLSRLEVAWGDGETGSYVPDHASPYPDGAVTHVYRLKTCSPEYRTSHPSGGLCHPTLEHYSITVTFEWVGSYSVGGPWVDLGTLSRTATVDYDVDEARGVTVP